MSLMNLGGAAVGVLWSMYDMLSRGDDDPRHPKRELPDWAKGLLLAAGVVVAFTSLFGLIAWLLTSSMTKTDGPYQITSGRTSYITEQYYDGHSDGCLHFATKDLGKVRVCGSYSIKKITDASYLTIHRGR